MENENTEVVAAVKPDKNKLYKVLLLCICGALFVVSVLFVCLYISKGKRVDELKRELEASKTANEQAQQPDSDLQAALATDDLADLDALADTGAPVYGITFGPSTGVNIAVVDGVPYKVATFNAYAESDGSPSDEGYWYEGYILAAYIKLNKDGSRDGVWVKSEQMSGQAARLCSAVPEFERQLFADSHVACTEE
ncbi:MAG: hypothetical protein LBM12_01990 [Candidatus Nomurabacteria bacterium]|jgi:hypothetical protein|nr:hypothetical protein [Candidatus Nomurabacteria bacterium]